MTWVLEMLAPPHIRLVRGRAPAWAWLGFGLLAVAAYALALDGWAGDLTYQLTGYASIALGVVGLRRRHRLLPRWWALVLGGAAVWLTGDLVGIALDGGGADRPFPSPVDALYVGGYVLVLGGIGLAWRTRTVRPLGGLLDSAVVGIAAGVLVWVFVADPGHGRHPLATATAIVFPMLDVALLVGLGQLLVLPKLGSIRALQALAVSFAVLLVGDTAYVHDALRGSYESGRLPNAAWLACYVGLGFAGLHPSAAALEHAVARPVRMTRSRLAVLAAACLATIAASNIGAGRDALLFAVAVPALVAATFLRMALLSAQQHRTEAQIRESRELYRALVEQNRDLVTLFDTDMTVAYTSASWQEQLGWTPAQMLGMHLTDLVHPDDAPLVQEKLTLLAQGARPGAPILRLRRRTGGWLWVETTARYVAAPGDRSFLLASSRDVSERHEAQRALAETTRTLQTLVDSIPAAVVETDVDGRVQIWNPEAERLFGWAAEETIGRPLPLLTGGELERSLARVRSGSTFQEEVQRTHRTGERIDVLVSGTPLLDEDGRLEGALVVYLDVRERKELEERLRQSQRMEAIGQLAGGVAHDFNNLLTAISGYAELALARAAGDSALEGQIDSIARAAERAADLTRQLLAFSRRQLLRPSVFDLNEVVVDTESLLRRVLGEHIEVVAELDPATCPIRADQSRIEQVLMNLVVNARDSMPDGGTLTIQTATVTLAAGDAVSFGGDEGEYVRLRVCDTGCGMDAETRLHAFEPFFTTKEQGRGTGLGLATVYGIVTQSGGSVRVESAPGEGTCFEVLLPRSAAALDPPRARDPDASPGSERILLVEDEPIVRDLTREMLEHHGYEVLCAPGPHEAIELADGGPIDLLLTDVVMPGMSGRMLAEQLRAERPGLRVLYTSGYSNDAAFQGGMLEERAAFLQKPYSTGELGRALRHILDTAS